MQVSCISSQLDPELLDRGLLLAHHALFLVQLDVEQAFKLAMMPFRGAFSSCTGSKGDSADIEPGGRTGHVFGVSGDVVTVEVDGS